MRYKPLLPPEALAFSRLLLILLLIVCTSYEQQAIAQNMSDYTFFDSNKDDPIEIIADKLVVQRKLGEALFKGHVRITQGNMNLRSDEIRVTTHNRKQILDNHLVTDSEIFMPSNFVIGKIEATGSVEFFDGNRTVKGQWIRYNLQNESLIIGGGISIVDNAIVITGDILEVNLKYGRGIVRGKKGTSVKTIIKSGSRLDQNNGFISK